MMAPLEHLDEPRAEPDFDAQDEMADWAVDNAERVAQLWPPEQPSTGRCRRCGDAMLPGIAMGQTWSGVADFIGGDVVTVSAGGPGRLIACMKCQDCGHSVTPEATMPPQGVTSVQSGDSVNGRNRVNVN